jgi:hypothetical protein
MFFQVHVDVMVGHFIVLPHEVASREVALSVRQEADLIVNSLGVGREILTASIAAFHWKQVKNKAHTVLKFLNVDRASVTLRDPARIQTYQTILYLLQSLLEVKRVLCLEH